jgi:hypothetical protein
MTHVSEPGFLVLHGLRLKGFATSSVLSGLTGLQKDDVDGHLDKLRAEGLVQYRDGRITGWSLSQTGRATHADRCREEVSALGCFERVDVAYRDFLEVNQPFLAVCTDWQLRAGPDGVQAINDHTDPGHDESVRAQLRQIHASVTPICLDLSALMVRFSLYGPRLEHALGRLEAGENEWFTGALIDSYHTVWFELHEDLLATLGVARDSEVSR